ncbi:sulfide:quinone oxidoreductase, mitochondrial-like [Mercenaria mercenaria]|uniref:sulfide:quinone oxidoreductase, mitochondrial-like n=1 Tax=Mercenaria mercenaria TaxID=6596 RepID=UPI00234FB368|nr:sulfide:quinone oxidoreductase, mitochondrial-like [Mercenaria mercenaria]
MTTSARALRTLVVQVTRKYSSTADKVHYKVVVAGGGAGGCAVAARVSRALGPGNVAVIEPAKYHYYQPLWTLVGAGIKTVAQTARPMKDVLPKKCDHHTEAVAEFDPENNSVTLGNGKKLSYDYLVVALGIQIDLNKVEGLIDALDNDPLVGSIYLPDTAEKTFSALQKFKGGDAVFTFPNTPIKCAGAPQKIMYLADEFWRKQGVRDKAEINYFTSLGKMFGVEKYAASLREIVKRKNIKVNFRTSLKAVDHIKKTVTIELLDSESGEVQTHDYDFLHVAPPMSAPDPLKNAPPTFVDSAGFLDVNQLTMQHKTYPNVFGLGDGSNIPTAKTAAAVGAQNKILFNSLQQVMKGVTPNGQYDGYTACPLVVSYHTCIMAEFDFSCEPLETFPVNQAKARRSMYYMKKNVFPEIYWNLLLKGHWSGNKVFRKALHLGMSK